MNSKVVNIKIDDIKPAKYNPRKIKPEQFEELKCSLNKIGFVVPVIINGLDNTIIAGHQRTKSAKAIGLENVPALVVNAIVKGDEIKFNQMHNGVERKNINKITLDKNGYEKEQFIVIKNADMTVKNNDFEMPSVKEICNLLLKYGNVMSCVICKRKVVFASEYVYACKLLNMDINAYICDDEKMDHILHYFVQDYGEYSYDNIERNTFVQGLAQLFRNVNAEENKKSYASTLYTEMVLPYLSDNSVSTILDFGCGKGAYINSLKAKYRALGLEFYNNNHKQINVTMGNKMIDDLIDYFKTQKTFDLVICDSVLNSVDSEHAEYSVVRCLNLFAKDRLFISGRPKRATKEAQRKKSTAIKNQIHYLDDKGFTATYREGKWFFQKFHEKNQFVKLMNDCGFDVVRYVERTTSFQAECIKTRSLSKDEYIDAIQFEFNLPLPNGTSYMRHNDVLNVLEL